MKNIRKALNLFWRSVRRSRSSDYLPMECLIFDPEWYIGAYPDLADVDPRKHYSEWGRKEGRRPSLHFDPAWYSAHRPDVPVSTQLSHYCEYGWREGSSPSPFFDPGFYLNANPDVAAAGCEPLRHYLEFGWREGRDPHPAIKVRDLLMLLGGSNQEPINKLFLVRFSPGSHPMLGWDTLRAGTTLSAGIREFVPTAPQIAASEIKIIEDEWSRRWADGQITPWFDEHWYLSQYPAVAGSARNAFDHYRTEGWRENKWPNPVFEPAYYKRTNPDLAEDVEPLDHYVTVGRFQGRAPLSLFYPEWFVREWRAAGSETISLHEALPTYLVHPAARNISTHPLFDPLWYRKQQGVEAIESPLEDYLHRRQRLISPHPLVDEQWYHDVFMKEDTGPALKQYLEYGHSWGWAPHPLFDEAFYKDNSQCLLPGSMHYLLYGEAKGIRPNPYFSPFYYKSTYYHLDGAEQSPLTHFAQTGDAQGLSPSAEFNAKLYRSKYLSFGKEWRAMRHYMTKGRYEGVNLEDLIYPLSFRQWLAVRNNEPSLKRSVNDKRFGLKVIVKSMPNSTTLFFERELQSSDICEIISVCYVEESDDIWDCIEVTNPDIHAYLFVDDQTILARRDFDILVSELISGQVDVAVPMIVDMETGLAVANNDTVQDAVLRPHDWQHPSMNVRHINVRAAGPVMIYLAAALKKDSRKGRTKVPFADFIAGQKKAVLYAPRALALSLNKHAFSCAPVPAIKGKRLLYIDSTVPRPDQDAGSDTAFRVLQMLRNDGWEITFLPDADYRHGGRYTEALQNLGICTLYSPYVRYSADFIENCDQDFDVIFLARVYSGGSHFERVKSRWPCARVIFNTVDLHYLREQREAVLKNDVEGFARSVELKARELDLISKVDATIVLSSAEQDILEREGIKDNIFVVPPVFEANSYVSYNSKERKDVFFLGGYAHIPNVDAVDFFIEEVWPLVLEKRNDISFHIVGANPPEHFYDYESDTVKVVGYVENLDEFLSVMRINVAPLRYGAGVKVKVIAGLASGVPCIATSIAVEGTGISDENGVVVANDAKEIANTIVDLYDDHARLLNLSKNGRELVEKKYSMSTIENIYRDILIPKN